jgi:hypothetical protein
LWLGAFSLYAMVLFFMVQVCLCGAGNASSVTLDLCFLAGAPKHRDLGYCVRFVHNKAGGNLFSKNEGHKFCSFVFSFKKKTLWFLGTIRY